MLHASGVAAATARLEERLQRAETDSAVGFPAFYQGAFAADLKRWSDHALAVARLKEQALRYQAAADTSAARVAEGAAQALDGYALWRRGQLEPAVRTLKIAQQQTTGIAGPEQHINATLRWWLGELLVELDRLPEAEVYFKSVAEDPYLPSIHAWYRLGSLYEKVGRYQEAREAYDTFTIGWQDADPELQPMVEEARAAVKRLSSSIKE
jgi:tetratricopeptide (TPR) repeat protein